MGHSQPERPAINTHIRKSIGQMAPGTFGRNDATCVEQSCNLFGGIVVEVPWLDV